MVAARLVRVAGQVGQRGDAVERLGADDGHPDIPRPAGDDGPGPHHIPDTLQLLQRFRDGIGGLRSVVLGGRRFSVSILAVLVSGLRLFHPVSVFFGFVVVPRYGLQGRPHGRMLRHGGFGQPFPVPVASMEGQRGGGPDVALGGPSDEQARLGVISCVRQAGGHCGGVGLPVGVRGEIRHGGLAGERQIADDGASGKFGQAV